MGKPTILKKMCSHCGQLKPLSAFVKLPGVMGAVYGNICDTCRQSAEKSGKGKEKEGTTASTTGFKIDAKSKLHEDLDKQQLFKKAEERYHEDREKDAKVQSTKEQKIATKAKEEKNHRQYLASRSFLNPPKKASDSNQPIFGGEQHVQKESEINLTAPMIDTQVGKEKFKSLVFKQFQTLLGKNAPISRFIEQSLEKGEPADESKTLTEQAEKSFRPKKP